MGASGRWEAAGTRWLLAVGMLTMLATVPTWGRPTMERGSALAALVGLTSAAPGTAGLGPAGADDLGTATWLRTLETEGVEGAVWRLRELALHRPGARATLDATALVAAGRRAVRAGHADTAIDIHTLAVTMEPDLSDAYLALADACLAAGDAACAGRAYRALARSVKAGRR